MKIAVYASERHCLVKRALLLVIDIIGHLIRCSLLISGQFLCWNFAHGLRELGHKGSILQDIFSV